jgi:hypothetical protein
MNPIMRAALRGFRQEDETGALIRLRDQLATRGINAELHNDNRALKVIKPEPGLPVWVFVGYGGAYYSWQSAEKRHPIDDVDGAAKVLAAYVAR